MVDKYFGMAGISDPRNKLIYVSDVVKRAMIEEAVSTKVHARNPQDVFKKYETTVGLMFGSSTLRETICKDEQYSDES